jgi:hypothetical protein
VIDLSYYQVIENGCLLIFNTPQRPTANTSLY